MNKIIFVFCHIEKCGGSSLRKILYEYFKNNFNNKQFYYPEINNIKIKNMELPELKEKYPKTFNDIKIIIGHCFYKNCKNIYNCSETFFFTSIRNPIDRFISHYNYFDYKRYNKELNNLSENEFLNYIEINKKNYYRRITLNNFEEKNFEEIYNNFNFILVLENIDDELLELQKKLDNKFNFSHKLKNQIINKNNQNINKTLNKKYLNILKIKLEKEIKFYNFIIKKKYKTNIEILNKLIL